MNTDVRSSIATTDFKHSDTLERGKLRLASPMTGESSRQDTTLCGCLRFWSLPLCSQSSRRERNTRTVNRSLREWSGKPVSGSIQNSLAVKRGEGRMTTGIHLRVGSNQGVAQSCWAERKVRVPRYLIESESHASPAASCWEEDDEFSFRAFVRRNNDRTIRRKQLEPGFSSQLPPRREGLLTASPKRERHQERCLQLSNAGERRSELKATLHCVVCRAFGGSPMEVLSW